MTELSAARPVASMRGEAAKARIARRYAAERRFRFYGIAAILVTATFVAVLLLDILIKGLPAFTEHRLVLNLTASAEASSSPKRTAVGSSSKVLDEPITSSRAATNCSA